jgi:hypothetical protein
MKGMVPEIMAVSNPNNTPPRAETVLINKM